MNDSFSYDNSQRCMTCSFCWKFKLLSKILHVKIELQVKTASAALLKSTPYWQTVQYIYSNLRSKSLKQKIPQYLFTKSTQNVGVTVKQWAKQNYKMNLFQKCKGTFTIQQDGKQLSPQELTALKLNMKLGWEGGKIYLLLRPQLCTSPLKIRTPVKKTHSKFSEKISC